MYAVLAPISTEAISLRISIDNHGDRFELCVIQPILQAVRHGKRN